MRSNFTSSQQHVVHRATWRLKSSKRLDMASQCKLLTVPITENITDIGMTEAMYGQ